MSIDNVKREPVLPVTGTKATKLVQHDGSALVALDLTTPEGMRRFTLNEETGSLSRTSERRSGPRDLEQSSDGPQPKKPEATHHIADTISPPQTH